MRIYNTAAELTADTLDSGQLIQTRGQNTVEDGLGGLFQILTSVQYASVTPTAFDVTLANGNKAHFQRVIPNDGYFNAGSVSGAVNLDCGKGVYGTFELTASAAITNLDVINPPEVFIVFILVEIGASPQAITWDSSIDFGGQGAPTLDTASTKELIVAFTVDGGLTWSANLAMDGLTV